MLARVANYLFWMGRYIERTEHTARFLKVQYFSSLEDPSVDGKSKNLQSVLDMVGIPYVENMLSEEYVLDKVALNVNHPNSILSTMQFCMANANNARDVISLELYEVIHKHYQFVDSFSAEYLKTSGLYDFTQSIIEHTAIIRNFVNSTLLHNEAWAIIRLGIHLERGIQVSRIVKAIEEQLKRIDTNDKSHMLYVAHYHEVLLKSLEGEVMFKKYYQGKFKEGNLLEFTMLNELFPRSVNYNIRESVNLCNKLFKKSISEDLFKFRINKFADEIKYTLYSDIKVNHLDFVKKTLSNLEFITYSVEHDHLSL